MYYEIVGTNVRLLGSLHRWPSDVASSTLPDWVWNAYSWSQQLYLEHDTSNIQRFARITNGPSLQHRLPASIWDRLRAKFPPTANIAPFKPWVVLMELRKMGITTVEGVETQLTSRARADSKKIVYLESVAEFMDVADKVSDADWVQVFTVALDEFDRLQQAMREMYPTWITRDVAKVEALDAKMRNANPTIAKLIMEDRNLAWLPRIKATLHTPIRTLIVVGAAHLTTAASLLALLSHAGYAVQLVD